MMATETLITGAMPEQFAVSLFRAPARTNTDPVPTKLTWAEICGLCSQHERRTDQDGHGWNACTFALGTTRKNENVEVLSLFIADRDHVTLEDYQDDKFRLTSLGIAFAAYSTYSYDPLENASYRVVLPLTEPVPRSEWPRVWRAISHRRPPRRTGRRR
jgi:hypothetical protein